MGAEFKSWERSAARFLDRFPNVKATCKEAYSRIVYHLNRPSERSVSEFPIEKIGDDAGSETYFGYYDRSPESAYGYVLAHSTRSGTMSSPKPGEVDLIVHSDGQVMARKPALACNLQQGTKAHWISPERFLFNDFDHEQNRYVSRICSASDPEDEIVLEAPVQDSFEDKFSLGVDMRRVSAVDPDYGYTNLPAMSNNELRRLDSDGVTRVDLRSGETSLLVPMVRIVELAGSSAFDAAMHCLNHVMISPEGKRFLAVHRYYTRGKRRDHLILGSAEDGAVELLSESGFVSHLCWLDGASVFGYLSNPCGERGYWVIDLTDRTWSKLPDSPLDGYGDGHPSIWGDWIVTDTYPDRSRRQHLYMTNWRSGECVWLGSFFHPFGYSGASRCDLHPRFSPDGRSVWFDSLHTGRRQLYRMDL